VVTGLLAAVVALPVVLGAVAAAAGAVVAAAEDAAAGAVVAAAEDVVAAVVPAGLVAVAAAPAAVAAGAGVAVALPPHALRISVKRTPEITSPHHDRVDDVNRVTKRFLLAKSAHPAPLQQPDATHRRIARPHAISRS